MTRVLAVAVVLAAVAAAAETVTCKAYDATTKEHLAEASGATYSAAIKELKPKILAKHCTSDDEKIKYTLECTPRPESGSGIVFCSQRNKK